MKAQLTRAGGVVGPTVFIGAWIVLGATRTDYSPRADAISELARIESSTAPAMTVAMVVFALSIATFAFFVSGRLNRSTAVALALCSVGTLGVAATPLGSTVEKLHFLFVALSYAGLVAAPVAASSSLARGSKVAMATTLVAALALTTSTLAPAEMRGLLQRLGLTVVDLWIVATALGYGLPKAQLDPGRERGPHPHE